MILKNISQFQSFFSISYVDFYVYDLLYDM